MRPINSDLTSSSSSSPSPITSTRIKLWRSPIPYLFGGLALMVALISVALVILVCSYRKRASQSSISAQDQDNMMKQAMPKNIVINSEPELLVIMAGDDKPTFLAKPIISSSNYCTCQITNTNDEEEEEEESAIACPNEPGTMFGNRCPVIMEPANSSSSYSASE